MYVCTSGTRNEHSAEDLSITGAGANPKTSGANATIASYNVSVVKMHNTKCVRFEHKNSFFCFEKTL
jgi:hypothetical protein